MGPMQFVCFHVLGLGSGKLRLLFVFGVWARSRLRDSKVEPEANTVPAVF